MPVSARARAAYRAGERQGHTLLNDQEKKRLLKVGRLNCPLVPQRTDA